MKQFEDAFMEEQSSLISLCLEFAEGQVDKVFAYASIEEKTQGFNAFFQAGRKIKAPHQIDPDPSMVQQFLNLGTSDLTNIRKICAAYQNPVPTEIKMTYDVKTGKFDAQYQYQPVCTAETGVDLSEVFLAWMEDERKKLKWYRR